MKTYTWYQVYFTIFTNNNIWSYQVLTMVPLKSCCLSKGRGESAVS